MSDMEKRLARLDSLVRVAAEQGHIPVACCEVPNIVARPFRTYYVYPVPGCDVCQVSVDAYPEAFLAPTGEDQW